MIQKKKLENFLEFVGDSVIVTHNVNYDIDHINKELKKYNLNTINKANCICTMTILKILQNYSLKGCADFYNINGIRDYHKGIVDATVLAILVCKMAENNDKDYNLYKYRQKNVVPNKRHKIYISLTGRKYHLYSLCGNLMCSSKISITNARKNKLKLCKRCEKKFAKINYTNKVIIQNNSYN